MTQPLRSGPGARQVTAVAHGVGTTSRGLALVARGRHGQKNAFGYYRYNKNSRLTDPDAIAKGAGYETEYPTATYVVRASDVRRAIRKVMRVRRSANQLERHNRRSVALGI